MRTIALAAFIGATQALSKIELAQVAEGVLLGFFKAGDYENVVDCIQDVQTIATDAETTITDFKEKDLDGIVAGLKEMGVMVKDVKTAMTDCESVSDSDWEKLTSAVEMMTKPVKFAFHVGKDILVNGVQIYEDIENAETNWSAASYEAFGENVGDALEKILIGDVLPENIETYYGISKVQVAQIVEGVLIGALNAEDMGDIASCIEDADSAVEHLNAAIHDFQEKSVSGVEAGLNELASAVQEISGAVGDCANIKADWEKVVTFTQSFSSPRSFAYHVGKDLLVNGKDIYADINDAVSQWNSQGYEKFGEDVGDALAKVFVGDVTPEFSYYGISKVQVAEVVEGILIGALNAEGLGDISSCIKDADAAVVDLNSAIHDFEKKTASGVESGLQEIAQAITSIKSAVSDCANIKADWEEIVEFTASFSNPTSFAYHVGKELLVNGSDIYSDINGAVAMWNSENYEKFGEDVGDALAKVFVGQEIFIQ